MNQIILIIGSEGQLGNELINYIPGAIGTSRNPNNENYLDLRETTSISEFIERINPDVIINAAAMTSVDGCEINRKEAWLVNGRSLNCIVSSIRKNNARLIHVSTDYIFDGIEGQYSEDSYPNPINYYGMSKLIGDIFSESYKNSLIVRTSGVYGTSYNFPRFVVNTLSKGQKVPILKGFYSPIHARNLAKSIAKLVKRDLRGVINVAGERISRETFAKLLANAFELDSSLAYGVEFLEGLKAKRPFDSSLDISKAKQFIDFDFHSLNSNMSELIRDYE